MSERVELRDWSGFCWKFRPRDIAHCCEPQAEGHGPQSGEEVLVQTVASKASGDIRKSWPLMSYRRSEL